MGPVPHGIDAGTAAATARDEVLPGAAPPPSATKHILFVDDDEALLFLGSKILGRLGYEVTTFEDPRSALACFRDEPDAFDAVVTDVSMPAMSGFELAEAILSVRPGIPVVITSGYIRPEDEKSASRLAVRALIPKPGTVDELGSVLDRIFRGAASNRLAGPARRT